MQPPRALLGAAGRLAAGEVHVGARLSLYPATHGRATWGEVFLATSR